MLPALLARLHKASPDRSLESRGRCKSNNSSYVSPAAWSAYAAESKCNWDETRCAALVRDGLRESKEIERPNHHSIPPPKSSSHEEQAAPRQFRCVPISQTRRARRSIRHSQVRNLR